MTVTSLPGGTVDIVESESENDPGDGLLDPHTGGRHPREKMVYMAVNDSHDDNDLGEFTSSSPACHLLEFLDCQPYVDCMVDTITFFVAFNLAIFELFWFTDINVSSAV